MEPVVVCHIGLHKTASGTLQRQFFPACSGLQLFTTQQKYTAKFIRSVTCRDPIYFDPLEARSMLEPYLAEGKLNLISNESLSGPPYAGLIEYGLDHRSPVLHNLSAVFPNARILIVLRRQDSLARSLYRQYLKRGGTEKVERFFGLSSDRKPALMPLDRFRYGRYIAEVEAAFPAGLKILLFEDFVSEQQQFLTNLCRFLGIQHPNATLRVENATRLGPLGMELSRWANFAFYSMVNKGPLPPLPRRQFGRWRLVSPVELLHDYWPGRGNPGERISAVCRNILAEVAADNEALDRKYALGLSERGYY